MFTEVDVVKATHILGTETRRQLTVGGLPGECLGLSPWEVRRPAIRLANRPWAAVGLPASREEN